MYLTKMRKGLKSCVFHGATVPSSGEPWFFDK